MYMNAVADYEQRVRNRLKIIPGQYLGYKIRYVNNEEEETERRITPLSFFRCGEHEYVRAYCFLRHEQRTFALRRMVILDVDGEEDLEAGGGAWSAAEAGGTGGLAADVGGEGAYDWAGGIAWERVDGGGADGIAWVADEGAKRPVAVKQEPGRPGDADWVSAGAGGGTRTRQTVPAIRAPSTSPRARSPFRFFVQLLWLTFFTVLSTVLVMDYYEENSSSATSSSSQNGQGSPTPAPAPAPPLPASWTYRGYPLYRLKDGRVLIQKMDVVAGNGREAHYVVNASLFFEATGLNDLDLVMDYIRADLDKNGHLSWQEVIAFQRQTYRRFAYRNNGTALPPDRFRREGGGDCEDFALYTCGMLEFWGWNCKVASFYPPRGGDGHAIAFVWSAEPIAGLGAVRITGSSASGRSIRPGYWIPIDYDSVGEFSNAMGDDWQLWELNEPTSLYGVYF